MCSSDLMVDQKLWREHFAKHGTAFPKPNEPYRRQGLRLDPVRLGLSPEQMQAAQRVVNETFVAQIGQMNPKSAMQAILQAPKWLIGALPKEATFPVIWDSGASISLSPVRSDFVGPLQSTGILRRVQGIAKGLSIKGEGHVAWTFLDAAGQLRTIKVPAYYVPDARVRLLSTTSLLQAYPDETITAEAHQMTLSGVKGNKVLGSVVAKVNPNNNLPTCLAYRYDVTATAPQVFNATLTEVSQ